jgi:hypothetical protein
VAGAHASGRLGELVTFEPGEHILFRSVKDGQLHGVLPVTVVRDDDELSVVYLAEGTPIRWPALADGRDMRSIPPEDAFASDWTTVGRTWEGQGILMVTPPGQAHSVWHFWHEPNRSFWGWYVNLQAPLRRTPLGYDSEDHTLDIWVEAPRTWEWKDEHELEAAVKAGYYTAEKAAAIRAEGERVIQRIERWESPFSDGWDRWQPDPAWPVPELRPDWDRL